ncbi:hypothetical protein HK097_006464, partial [Rhizophlyctis rosea]
KVYDAIASLPDVYQSDFTWVPDEVFANVLSPGGNTLIVQKGFPESMKILVERFPGLRVVELDMSEIIKGDGALTCGSILI